MTVAQQCAAPMITASFCRRMRRAAALWLVLAADNGIGASIAHTTAKVNALASQSTLSPTDSCRTFTSQNPERLCMKRLQFLLFSTCKRVVRLFLSLLWCRSYDCKSRGAIEVGILDLLFFSKYLERSSFAFVSYHASNHLRCHEYS
jgi:hypothetical protein